MEEKKLTLAEQLQSAKRILALTGAVHDAQLFQLQRYPLLLTGVKSATVSIDVERHIVYYSVESKKSLGLFEAFRPDKIKSELDHLYVWTRWLLWDDVVVEVDHKNKTVYRMSPENWKEPESEDDGG